MHSALDSCSLQRLGSPDPHAGLGTRCSASRHHHTFNPYSSLKIIPAVTSSRKCSLMPRLGTWPPAPLITAHCHRVHQSQPRTGPGPGQTWGHLLLSGPELDPTPCLLPALPCLSPCSWFRFLPKASAASRSPELCFLTPACLLPSGSLAEGTRLESRP